MFNMEKFSKLLSSKRRDKGLSQGQLAELVGVTHQAVSKWERGEAMPEISKMGDIAKVIDTSASELLDTLYENETPPAQKTQVNNADEEYYALPDKTRIGDLYALAPKISKETLHIAIDTLIAAKGAGSATMLFQFADREYLTALGTRLFSMGDTRLAEYVDDTVLKSSIVDNISNADATMDNSAKTAFYKKAGQLLTYCKDVKFVDDMFAHFTVSQYRWDIWREFVGKFPSEAVVNQGIKMAVHHGPGCFHSWWDIIGRRNIAKIFLGYIDNYEKNNYRAWQDVFQFYRFADYAIMESAIKERINDPETDLNVFKHYLGNFSPELQNLFAQKGITQGNNRNNNQTQPRGVRKTANSAEDLIQGMIMNKVQEEINDADLDEIPAILSNITKTLAGFRTAMGNPSSSGGISDEMLVSVMERLEEITSRLDEIESRLDELDGRIDELDEKIEENEQ